MRNVWRVHRPAPLLCLTAPAGMTQGLNLKQILPRCLRSTAFRSGAKPEDSACLPMTAALR